MINNHRGLWRGKRTDTKAWITGDLMSGTDIIDCTEIAEHTGVGSRYDVIPETLGECTGLTDKNGKLIFEGDILGFDSGSGSYDLVEYHNGVFGVRTIPEDGGEKYSCCEFPLYEELNDCVPAEIIGNIHDNPELISGQTD